jgi:DNA-binding NtrC family response regulator
VHASAQQASGAFVAVYCDTFAPADADAILFGLPAGQRNDGGAAGAPRGRYERVWPGGALHEAVNGTLYLRRIEEMPERTQSRLARVLRDGEALIGASNTPARLNIRPVAAVDLGFEREVSDGRIRPDLHKRFAATTITVPPLRERREDIPALASHFAACAAMEAGLPPKALSAPALSLLAAMPWRGNARELLDLIGPLVTATPDPEIGLEDLLQHLNLEDKAASPPAMRAAATLREARARFEREYIAAVLAQHKGRIPEAARSLGIQRTNLYRKLRSLRVPRALSTHT